MTWLNLSWIEAIQNCLRNYIRSDRLTVYPFHNIEVFYRKRFFKANLGSEQLLIKMQEFTGKDSLKKEYQIGCELNYLRSKIPNFVGTFAYFKGNPQTKQLAPAIALPTSYDVRYLALEFLEGDSVSGDLDLDTLFRVYLQVFGALHVAYKSFRFTHYNLHRGNVMLVPSEISTFKYPGYKVQAPFTAVIIDFGRSFTSNTGGIELPSHDVYKRPNVLHDIMLFLISTLKRKHKDVCRDLCAFYGMDYNHQLSSYDNIKEGMKKAKYRQPSELLDYLVRRYRFKPILDHSAPSCRMTDKPINLKPYLTSLSKPTDIELAEMRRFRLHTVD